MKITGSVRDPFYFFSRSLRFFKRRRLFYLWRNIISHNNERLKCGRWVAYEKVSCLEGVEIPEHMKCHRMASYGSMNTSVLGHVRVSNGDAFGYSIITTRPLRKNWEVIFLDLVAGRVLRLSSTPSYDERYYSIRDKLSSFLPSPAYEKSSDSFSIHEEFVSGVSLESFLGSESGHGNSVFMGGVVETICGYYKNAYLYKADSVSFSDEACSLLSACGVGDCSLQFNSAVVNDILSFPVIPSHADLQSSNIIFDNGILKAVDLSASSIKYMPFWFDVLRFVFSWDPQGYFSGRYDSMLDSLFDAFGMGFSVERFRNELAVGCAVLLDHDLRISDKSVLCPRELKFHERVSSLRKRIFRLANGKKV